eukprot:m.252678 g.252678  ORF g.252678 m.252678 type:complete len:397 (-) comp19569_c0_seq8:507-1697(-)
MAGRHSLPSPDPWFVLRGHTDAVTALNFLDDASSGSLLLSGDGCGWIRLWDLKTKRTVADCMQRHASKGILSVTPVHGLDNANVLVHGREGSVSLLRLDACGDGRDGRGFTTVSTFADATSDRPGGLCFCKSVVLPQSGGGSGHSPMVALPANDPANINLFDLRACRPASVLQDPSGLSSIEFGKCSTRLGMCMCMEWCPSQDDRACSTGELVCGHEDGSLVVWDMTAQKPRLRQKLQDQPIVALDVDRATRRQQEHADAGSANSAVGDLRVVSAGASSTIHITRIAHTTDTGNVASEGSPKRSTVKTREVVLKHEGINSVSLRRKCNGGGPISTGSVKNNMFATVGLLTWLQFVFMTKLPCKDWVTGLFNLALFLCPPVSVSVSLCVHFSRLLRL